MLPEKFAFEKKFIYRNLFKKKHVEQSIKERTL